MNRLIYVVSDSVGETADLVIQASKSQFQSHQIETLRFPYVNEPEVVDNIIRDAKEKQALIAFTIVIKEIKAYLVQQAEKNRVPYIDILGPSIQKMSQVFKEEPMYEPGLIHKLDEDYFQRVEAIEFAVKYDDGRDPRGILRADVVLIGVSRTSKTPLSQYLALKRLKVANVPVVPEVEPPEELFKINPKKCFGLRISPTQLNDIRKERLRALGLAQDAHYARLERIEQELEHFESVTQKIGCEIINVSNRAVEETANIILNTLKKKIRDV